MSSFAFLLGLLGVVQMVFLPGFVGSVLNVFLLMIHHPRLEEFFINV